MTDKEKITELRTTLLLLLDSMDFTTGACGPTESVSGVVPPEILKRAQEASKIKP